MAAVPAQRDLAPATLWGLDGGVPQPGRDRALQEAAAPWRSTLSPLCAFLTVFWLFSLKLECDKLASEKSEMQRHYVMVRTVPGSRARGWDASGEQVPAPGFCWQGALALWRGRSLWVRLALAFLKAGLFFFLIFCVVRMLWVVEMRGSSRELSDTEN